jgi:DNA-binding CsgD family transcriptional regulator
MSGNRGNGDVEDTSKSDEHDGRLTAREQQVLELVAAGLRDDELALRLGIARSTVSSLLRSSMKKLDAHTRLEAVIKLAVINDEPASRPD